MIEKYNNKSKGFTLIELILVMSIILVISTFLIPKFNGYRNKAQKLKVIDTGRQIYLAAIESYAEGNETFNGDKILNAVNELLGISDVDVISSSNESVDINYIVDNKQYSIIFNSNEEGFIIKNDLGEQIYPIANTDKAYNRQIKGSTDISKDAPGV